MVEAADNDRTVSLETWWNNNIRFHLALNAVAGNSLINSTLDTVLRRLWRAVAQFFWDKSPEQYMNFAFGTHKKLLRAIEEDDRAAAKKILTADILSVRVFYGGYDKSSLL
jgi:DNA-binding GntR family transcriptional regulator